MWSILTAIPGLLSGLFGTLNHITDAIANEKINARNAQTEDERIAANERIKTLETKRDVLIAEAGVSRANIWVRMVLALPVAVVLFKLMVWDKVVGSFVGCSGRTLPGTCGTFLTDPLDDNQWRIIFIVVGFYFLYEGGMAITRIAKR